MPEPAGHSGPSLKLLWRLAAVPALMLVTAALFSLFLLTPWGPELTTERLSALWVLLASLIATVGGFVGALLAATTQERTRELEQNRLEREIAETRAARATQEQENERQAQHRVVESTIGGIRIFEVAPGNHIMAAGAFAMVVKQGDPVVALRMLSPALSQHDVDASTAVWVIDEVLRSPRTNDAAKRHAAFLLLQHAEQLTSDSVPGGFAWPSCLDDAWPTTLDEGAGSTVVWALADLLTSRRRSWWTEQGGDWQWALSTFFAALRDSSHDAVKDYAAWTLRLMYDADPEHWREHWMSDPEYQTAIRARGDVALPDMRQERLRRWMRGEEVARPTLAATAAESAMVRRPAVSDAGAPSADEQPTDSPTS